MKLGQEDRKKIPTATNKKKKAANNCYNTPTHFKAALLTDREGERKRKEGVRERERERESDRGRQL